MSLETRETPREWVAIILLHEGGICVRDDYASRYSNTPEITF